MLMKILMNFPVGSSGFPQFPFLSNGTFHFRRGVLIKTSKRYTAYPPRLPACATKKSLQNFNNVRNCASSLCVYCSTPTWCITEPFDKRFLGTLDKFNGTFHGL